jgi:nucleoside-diphosphate-sugar epimerase
MRGERPVIRSDGSPSKGYLHVSDIVQAYMLLAERAAGLDVRGRAFNIHPDVPITVLDLVRLIIKISDRPDIEPDITRQSDNHEHVWLANERSKRILGWEQKTTLEDGLRDTYNWLKVHAGEKLEQAAQVFHK